MRDTGWHLRETVYGESSKLAQYFAQRRPPVKPQPPPGDPMAISAPIGVHDEERLHVASTAADYFAQRHRRPPVKPQPPPGDPTAISAPIGVHDEERLHVTGFTRIDESKFIHVFLKFLGEYSGEDSAYIVPVNANATFQDVANKLRKDYTIDTDEKAQFATNRRSDKPREAKGTDNMEERDQIFYLNPTNHSFENVSFMQLRNGEEILDTFKALHDHMYADGLQYVPSKYNKIVWKGWFTNKYSFIQESETNVFVRRDGKWNSLHYNITSKGVSSRDGKAPRISILECFEKNEIKEKDERFYVEESTDFNDVRRNISNITLQSTSPYIEFNGSIEYTRGVNNEVTRVTYDIYDVNAKKFLFDYRGRLYGDACGYNVNAVSKLHTLVEVINERAPQIQNTEGTLPWREYEMKVTLTKHDIGELLDKIQSDAAAMEVLKTPSSLEWTQIKKPKDPKYVLQAPKQLIEAMKRPVRPVEKILDYLTVGNKIKFVDESQRNRLLTFTHPEIRSYNVLNVDGTYYKPVVEPQVLMIKMRDATYTFLPNSEGTFTLDNYVGDGGDTSDHGRFWKTFASFESDKVHNSAFETLLDVYRNLQSDSKFFTVPAHVKVKVNGDTLELQPTDFEHVWGTQEGRGGWGRFDILRHEGNDYVRFCPIDTTFVLDGRVDAVAFSWSRYFPFRMRF